MVCCESSSALVPRVPPWAILLGRNLRRRISHHKAKLSRKFKTDILILCDRRPLYASVYSLPRVVSNSHIPEPTNDVHPLASPSDSRAICLDDEQQPAASPQLSTTFRPAKGSGKPSYSALDDNLDAPLGRNRLGTPKKGKENALKNAVSTPLRPPNSSTSAFRDRATSVPPYKRKSLRRKMAVADLRTTHLCSAQYTAPSHRTDSESRTLAQWELNLPSTERVELIQTLDHFRSFCILDGERAGNPVACASCGFWPSEGLRFGEQAKLTLQLDDHKACDMLTGVDDNGNDTTYLALINKLLAPTTGQCRYMLISLLDVSDFLDAVTLEDMELERELLVSTLPPERSSLEPLSISSSGNTSLTELIGPDIWMQVANEGSSMTTTPSHLMRNSREVVAGAPSPGVGKLLEEFTAEIISLYKDFFLLARSRADERFYEISLISPSLHANGDCLAGNLKHTHPDVIHLLSKHLGSNDGFSIEILWGSPGTAKRMYCTPVFGSRSRNWICTLVDIDAPLLWRREVSRGGV